MARFLVAPAVVTFCLSTAIEPQSLFVELAVATMRDGLAWHDSVCENTALNVM